MDARSKGVQSAAPASAAQPASNGSGGSGGLLKHQLQLVKGKTSNRWEIAPVKEQLSFEKGFFLVIRALQLLRSRNDGIIIMGLAGPSGAGKTVFSEKVGSFIPGTANISMDMYNDASRLIDGNFDDPRLTDYDLLLENLTSLREGKAANVPIYDFRKSTRVGHRVQEVPASRIVIVEGIYALSERLSPHLDLKVSVTGGVHMDLVKRVMRDISRSAQEPESIIQQISETVYPMYKAFIEPDLARAHIRILNTFNPFSGFTNNATYILKSAKLPTHEEAIAVLEEPKHHLHEEKYDIYLLPPGEDPETCQTYLRMRNRDGRYSLMFEEWVVDSPFIISPRITFEVGVRVLGGLMALGYEIGTIIKRATEVYYDSNVAIKFDTIQLLGRQYIQIQGKDRETVARVGRQLGLEGTYVPLSYIEQVQREKLLEEFNSSSLTEEMRSQFVHIAKDSSSPVFSWMENAAPRPRPPVGPRTPALEIGEHKNRGRRGSHGSTSSSVGDAREEQTVRANHVQSRVEHPEHTHMQNQQQQRRTSGSGSGSGSNEESGSASPAGSNGSWQSPPRARTPTLALPQSNPAHTITQHNAPAQHNAPSQHNAPASNFPTPRTGSNNQQVNLDRLAMQLEAVTTLLLQQRQPASDLRAGWLALGVAGIVGAGVALIAVKLGASMRGS